MSNKDIVLQFPIRTDAIRTEEIAVQGMLSGLDTLIKVGAIKGNIDDILKDHKVNLNSGYIVAYLKPGSLYDGSKLNTVGASQIYEVPQGFIPSVDLSGHDKTFSAATIQERLRIAKYNPKQRFRLIVMDYKRFYATKKSEFEKHPENFPLLRNMFLTDLMGLFNEIVPFIAEGKQISTLIGISQVSSSLNKISIELSRNYKRAIQSEKNSGQINKSILQGLKSIYSEFLDKLIEVVFPGNPSSNSAGNNSTPNNSNSNSLSHSMMGLGNSSNKPAGVAEVKKYSRGISLSEFSNRY
jgi:hypothetical protein